MGGRDAPHTQTGAAGAFEGPGGSRPSAARDSDAGVVETWGILNVTRDSFSDGGRFVSAEGDVAVREAVADAERMWAEGADVIDVGGASSRPPGKTYGVGAPSISEAEELARVIPVIAELGARAMRVSIDTISGEVAARAIDAGATIVNDVSMGASDALLEAVARGGAELVLMHTRDGGRVDARTTLYRDVVAEVIAELNLAVERAVAHGVPAHQIWIDPGIGFAKTPPQSAMLLAATAALVTTGHRVLVGASRKSFLATLAPAPDGSVPPPDARLGGSLAAVALAVLGGAHAVRVHDVAASRQAALVSRAIRDAGRASSGSKPAAPPKDARADA